ncbi:hypothetical protein PanWU01x14_252880 [Parasponia andersonii]|uniref:RNase H type-1 domain-containing protein n=1 Tax=Parasponia andersonii TaxID=3476 RepID=A0A2P5BBV9_PARAD|nr:hypothetical protein PanWU01x14_252880 [Parasponia andersonii]
MSPSLPLDNTDDLLLENGSNWNKNLIRFVPLLIESDALNVVNLVNNPIVPLLEIGVIIKDIQNLLLSFPGCIVSFIPRNRNNVAHCLAKWSVANESEFVWLEDPLNGF